MRGMEKGLARRWAMTTVIRYEATRDNGLASDDQQLIVSSPLG